MAPTLIGYAPGAYDRFHVGHLELSRRGPWQHPAPVAGRAAVPFCAPVADSQAAS